ncbi:toxic anion resistance protein [Pseudomonas sp.]|uniref:toxic anion resistance protein n=1 Tax=Pseudomonas sp. TaxID=306 RepID=UPI0028AC048B|nr:toxic anion resistance protein [Pseudomonas sp.]
MNLPMISVEHIKTETLPALFLDSDAIGQYGAGAIDSSSVDRYSDLMETAAVSRLAGLIGQIVERLADADPRKMAKQPTRLERWIGKGLERQARYYSARKNLEDLIEEAQVHAQRVTDTLKALDNLLVSLQDEAARLRLYIQAAREFLDENPELGLHKQAQWEFDNPRDRLTRKIVNLTTLLSSHDMSVIQMRLTRAQALDMLDRFNETVTVLVPVWRQHTLTLLTTRHMSAEMVAEATRAHKDLLSSLSKSLDGIQ